MAKKDINKEKKKNNFFKELKSELKKVTWPTLKKLANNTLAVISIVLIVSIIVFVLDVCFENLNKFGIEKLKSVVSSDTENVENNETGEVTEETNDFDGIDLVPDNQTEENTTEGDNQSSETENNSETQTEGNSEETTQ